MRADMVRYFSMSNLVSPAEVLTTVDTVVHAVPNTVRLKGGGEMHTALNALPWAPLYDEMVEAAIKEANALNEARASDDHAPIDLYETLKWEPWVAVNRGETHCAVDAIAKVVDLGQVRFALRLAERRRRLPTRELAIAYGARVLCLTAILQPLHGINAGHKFPLASYVLPEEVAQVAADYVPPLNRRALGTIFRQMRENPAGLPAYLEKVKEERQKTLSKAGKHTKAKTAELQPAS